MGSKTDAPCVTVAMKWIEMVRQCEDVVHPPTVLSGLRRPISRVHVVLRESNSLTLQGLRFAVSTMNGTAE